MTHKKKGKRWMLPVIVFLFLLLLCGCEKDEQGSYKVRRINSAEQSDDYYIKLDHKILQYSVSKQEVTDSYENVESIDYYAIDDDYIFLVVNSKNVALEEELLKVDRQTRACDFFMETNHCSRLAIADGFLLYGEDRYYGDIYVCPIDGNPETDSISLLEQFADNNSQSWWQETVFQGLRVQRYDETRRRSYIASIIDEQSGEVILDFPGYTDYPSALWMGEEWLIFTKGTGDSSDFYYQRTNEAEKHRIDCLGNKRYCYSRIWDDYLTLEGQTVVGLLTVLKVPNTGGLPDYQSDIENDLLFEINLETDTSSIIYSTKNNRTRIIGYKAGMVYLLQDGMIYREKIEGTDREELLDLQEEGWDLYKQTIYFDWHGDYLIIWGVQEETIKIESLGV